jgi:hypothetical protein
VIAGLSGERLRQGGVLDPRDRAALGAAKAHWYPAQSETGRLLREAAQEEAAGRERSDRQ